MVRQQVDGKLATKITVDRARIADFFRRHHIRSLALFGSVLRDEFSPDSDVDILVQFEDGYTPGWELFDLEDELSSIPGWRVDLRMPQPVLSCACSMKHRSSMQLHQTVSTFDKRI